MRFLTIVSIAMMLTACGGGVGSSDPSPDVPTIQANVAPSVRKAAVVPAISAGGVIALHVYQALYGKAPAYAMLNEYVGSIGSSNGFAWAAAMVEPFKGMSDSDFSTLVLNNISITPTSLQATAVFGTSRQAYDGLQDALKWYFTSTGVASRGTVVIQLTDIVSHFEGETTFGVYGNAATSFNNQTAANFAYASDPTHTAPAVVPTANSTTAVVEPAGGALRTEGLVMTFPPAAVSNAVNVTVTPTSADIGFNAGATVLSGAYRIQLDGDLQQPVTLSLAAKTAAGATDLPLAAVVDDRFTDMYSSTPHRGITLLPVASGADGYTVTLPAITSTTQASARKSVSAARGLADPPTTTNSFTIYIFAGYAMKSSAHFNIRYPAKSCNSLVMTQWLQNAEEAYSRLVDTMKFDPIGLAMPATRMTIDVVELGPTEWGGLSFHTWTLGLFNNLVVEFQLPTRVCNSPTPDQEREMEVTIGHEFFHGIQNTYDPAHAVIKAIWNSRGLCLYDASSTWFEAEMLDSPSYLGTPAREQIFSGNAFYTKGLGYGCATDPQNYGYGAATFLRHLTNKYGSDLLLVLWRNILNGAGFGVPIDAMKTAGIAVADEWDAFSTKLLLGTTGMGWPLPAADSTLVYKAGNPPLAIVDSMYQFSSKKHKLDFTSLANSTAASPSCKFTLKKGSGTYSARLYHLTTLIAEVDKNFTPIASDKYSLILTNISDTQFTDGGIRYGRKTPVEVAIECAGDIQVTLSYSQYDFIDSDGKQQYCTTTDDGYAGFGDSGQWSATTYTYKATETDGSSYSFLAEFSSDYSLLKRANFYYYYADATLGFAGEIVDVPLDRSLSTAGTSFFTLAGSQAAGHVVKFIAPGFFGGCKELALTGGPVPFYFGLQLNR